MLIENEKKAVCVLLEKHIEDLKKIEGIGTIEKDMIIKFYNNIMSKLNVPTPIGSYTMIKQKKVRKKIIENRTNAEVFDDRKDYFEEKLSKCRNNDKRRTKSDEILLSLFLKNFKGILMQEMVEYQYGIDKMGDTWNNQTISRSLTYFRKIGLVTSTIVEGERRLLCFSLREPETYRTIIGKDNVG